MGQAYPITVVWERLEPLSEDNAGSQVARGSCLEEITMARHWLTVLKAKGNVSATFQVPGVISIPSDGDVHNVTITELKLSASMSWVCIPQVDTKVHLKVNCPRRCLSPPRVCTHFG